MKHSNVVTRLFDGWWANGTKPEPMEEQDSYCKSLVALRQRPQVLVWLLLFLIPASAFAMMPPGVYEEARETAMFHVQVKILNMTGPARTPGPCVVTGEVVRIFRDKPGTLKPGVTIEFAVDCSKPGDPVVIGGTLWTDYDRLRQAKYLEVFLNSTERGYEVALWQSRMIEAPTSQPAR